MNHNKINLDQDAQSLDRFTAAEVKPVAFNAEQQVEVVEEGQHDYWAVYLRYDPQHQDNQQFGGVEWVADFDKKEYATLLADALSSRITSARNTKSNETAGEMHWKAQGDANQYVIFDDSRRWLVSCIINGELYVPEQEALLTRFVASQSLVDALADAADALKILQPDSWVLKQAEVAITKAGGRLPKVPAGKISSM